MFSICRSYIIISGFVCLHHRLFSNIYLVFCNEGISNRQTLGFIKGVGHSTTNQDGIYLGEQIFDHTDFIRHLGSTQNSNEGTLGIVDALFQIPDLFFKKEAGNRRLNVFRNPCYRSVRAVTAAKSIIYKKVCPFCQLFGELRIILLFTRMKTDIFAEDNLPGLGCIHYLRSLRTHAIFSKMNRNIYQLCKMIGYRLQAEFRRSEENTSELQ